jgi:hypothetical protein
MLPPSSKEDGLNHCFREYETDTIVRPKWVIYLSDFLTRSARNLNIHSAVEMYKPFNEWT